MTTYRITLDEAPGFFDNRVQRAIREGAIKGLYAAALRGVNEIQTKILPMFVAQPVDRGVYKAGWRAQQEGEDAVILNRVPHAVFVEYGVRPGSVKLGRRMISALAEWASRKGAVPEGWTPVQAAWAMGKRMKGRGIFAPNGLQVLAKLEPVLPDFIRDEIAHEVERALG